VVEGRVVSAGRSQSRRRSRRPLEDGARIGVIGGGPAGSFFSIFVLDLAGRAGLRLSVDVYEPKDFRLEGPRGCNKCGGIVSESLVQDLAAEGVALPPTVIQRGIDSYVLHADVGDVCICTPMREKRIGAVHRGLGPGRTGESRYESFDAFLLGQAEMRGARVVRRRIDRLARDGGLPVLEGDGVRERYDLAVVACGVNGVRPEVPEASGASGPRTVKTAIREYFVGRAAIRQILGDSMHVFLLDMPRLELAALIPKGEYVSLCLIGKGIDTSMVQTFLAAREVMGYLPSDSGQEKPECGCAPRMNVGGSGRSYGERVVMIGDAGVARLYKDGIGSAFRTAKAAACAAVYEGVSAEDFRLRYGPVCRAIALDNAFGRVVFAVVRRFQAWRFARRALLNLVAREQSRSGSPPRMSTVLWDTFSGSASYREILLRSLHPALLLRFALELIAAALPLRSRGPIPGEERAPAR
jgi:flavin-dependent dehydrogenase